MRSLGMLPPSALPLRERKEMTLPTSALSPFVGIYEIAWGLELDVALRDGALFISSNMGGPPVQLVPESANDFFARGVDAQITFVRDANGRVTSLVLHQYGRDQQATKRR
jgi:D-alanyl-D-alanine-carboxypeptidase/D-alanyl-D-alanine-endopeptidase